MVNGNYVLYGDRPCSESEIVDDHVHSRTTERKTKRKANRSANELQYSLNLAQLDNETDSVKYEKKTKEPRLLRYVPTTDVEEHFVSEKFETYDLKPTEEPPRRYAFAKKPKNPSDGSVNYAYSRSSSSCSSPNGNLPTISEHGEQYGTYRIRAIRTSDDEQTNSYETKLDKYFSRPRDVKTFVAKGSHPDSLYRVPMDSGVSAGKLVRVLRVLRWPVALFSVCVALAIFVYFLMPDNLSTEFDTVNATTWQNNDNVNAQSRRNPEKPGRKPPENNAHPHKGNSRTKPQEIDFYDAENAAGIDLTSLMETITEKSFKIKTPAPPVFPTHLTPEVQYGNEKADTGKVRHPKLLEETTTKTDESTLKLHITHSPEKPLAIYFDEGKVVASTTTEAITRAESSNDIMFYDEKQTTKAAEIMSSKAYSPVYKDSSMYIRKDNPNSRSQTTEPELQQEIHDFYQLGPMNPDNRFTSGHSKLFGISIEDAEKMKSTTQNSLYNTRVSPTLPTWRDKIDSTTKNYPLNLNLDESSDIFRYHGKNPDSLTIIPWERGKALVWDATCVDTLAAFHRRGTLVRAGTASEAEMISQCRSTRLGICRGVLPYDLAGPAATLDDVDVTDLLPQIEFLVATNCSDRVAQFFCALLEPECSPAPYPPKMPCYNLCRAVAESCEGSIPRQLVAVFGCAQYPVGECSGARAPCSPREYSCTDGSCVPTHWACDGSADCPAGDDESRCSACAPGEFQCNSGGCVRSRWVCDGYSDCPRGEDEAESVCGVRRPEDTDAEPGEESAGSSPALAVHRPNRVQGINNAPIHRTGEVDSSKELLMTSDSNNALKRNFTRRPSVARLSPYNRPNHDSKANDKVDAPKTKIGEVKVTKSYSDNRRKHLEPVRNSAKPVPTLTEPTPPTHLDKSIHNLERVINGAAMLKKAEAQDESDSSEAKMETAEKTEEVRRSKEPVHFDGSVRAHASPCPSGELRCVDGRCITLAQLCDGTIDCSDHADEDNCYT